MQIPLIKGSEILVNHKKLYHVVRKCKYNPREMIRQIFLMLYTEQEIAEYTPTGKGYKAFPANIFEDVEGKI